MKSLMMSILLIGSFAQADVDPIAVGQILTGIKTHIEMAKNGAACLINKIETEKSCASFEEANKRFKGFLGLNQAMDSMFCYQGTKMYDASPLSMLRYNLNKAKELAKSAQPNDPILAAVNKVGQSLDALETEITALFNEAELQSRYVSQCILGEEPTTPSLKELLCK